MEIPKRKTAHNYTARAGGIPKRSTFKRAGGIPKRSTFKRAGGRILDFKAQKEDSEAVLLTYLIFFPTCF